MQNLATGQQIDEKASDFLFRSNTNCWECICWVPQK